jgi:hypothetical protein
MPPRRDPDTKQEKQIFDMATRGMSDKKIGEALNLPATAVTRTIDNKFTYVRDLDLYKEYKTSILNAVQHQALKVIVDRIPDANIRDLVGLVSLFEDKINLREGRSTANIALGIKIENLVDVKDKSLEGGASNPAREELPVEDVRTLLNGQVPEKLIKKK